MVLLTILPPYNKSVEQLVEFGAGLAIWTLIEYLMHRLAFHGFAPHTEHHLNPSDRRYILAPLWLSTSGACSLFGILWLSTGWWRTAASIVSGIIAGYLVYELIHLRIHSGKRGGRLLRALRKHHYYHHFASDRVCFGVTSPVWDFIFRTIPNL
jgi:sterol desaturase/sphingolipid hydroxylase (fatty acid hydroxylase superfamily)